MGRAARLLGVVEMHIAIECFSRCAVTVLEEDCTPTQPSIGVNSHTRALPASTKTGVAKVVVAWFIKLISAKFRTAKHEFAKFVACEKTRPMILCSLTKKLIQIYSMAHAWQKCPRLLREVVDSILPEPQWDRLHKFPPSLTTYTALKIVRVRSSLS